MDTMVSVFSTGPAGGMFSALSHTHRPDLSDGIWLLHEPKGTVPCTSLTHPEFGRVSQDVLPGSYSKSCSPMGDYLSLKFAKLYLQRSYQRLRK